MNRETERDENGHWTLIRDVAVLQVKLLVDGFRDLLLVPASLVAAVASLVNSADGRPGPEFYRLLALGRRSERWINLFGALGNESASSASASGQEHGDGPDEPKTGDDLDDIVSRVENFVVEEYRRGGVTKQAKERIDRALDALSRRRP